MRVHNFQNHLSILRNKVRSFANLFHALAGTLHHPVTQPPNHHPLEKAEEPPKTTQYQKLGRRNLPPYTSPLVRRENVLHSLTLINDFPPQKFSRRKPKTSGLKGGGGVENAGRKMHSWQQNCCCSLNRERRTEKFILLGWNYRSSAYSRAQ